MFLLLLIYRILGSHGCIDCLQHDNTTTDDILVFIVTVVHMVYIETQV